MGKSSMKIHLSLSMLAILSCDVALAGSVAGTGGSTEVTQILNNGQLVEQTSEMYDQTVKLRDQLRRQTDMVNDMKTQGKKLTAHEWGTTQSDLQRLAQIVREGEAIAYSSANVDALYREKYKGYSNYAREKNGTSQTYSDQYSDWSRSNMDSIVGSMKAAGLQQDQFANEEQTMQKLRQMGQTAQGRMEAIQVGNQIAAQQVGQLQKLRSLLMSQMQMQASYMAFQSNQKDSETAKNRKFFQNGATDVNIQNGQRF
jgi:P-type conjugative transfer protein TrbJ